VRLATFNVLHGRSLEDDRVDLNRFAAAVADLDADVLALQEVDRLQERSHRADLTEVAAQVLGAVAHRFAPALSGAPGAWTRASDADVAGTPQYGVALLSRLPVARWDVLRLPALRGQVPVRFPGRRRPELVRDEPRIAVVAHLDDGPTVAGTHLSFIPWWNLVQLRRLVGALPRSGPLALLGDLNMQPAPAARATRLQPLVSAPTYPVAAPYEQIDHVLGRGLRPGAGGAVRMPLSDHRALVVDVG
jgi:endonuclease/exonuclease/phosphatase family metal-dependent hydrolase